MDKYQVHSYHDWQYEVANGDTRLGYDDWVQHRIEALESSQVQVQTSGPQCKQCGAFTTAKRVETHGLCMRCETGGD